MLSILSHACLSTMLTGVYLLRTVFLYNRRSDRGRMKNSQPINLLSSQPYPGSKVLEKAGQPGEQHPSHRLFALSPPTLSDHCSSPPLDSFCSSPTHSPLEVINGDCFLVVRWWWDHRQHRVLPGWPLYCFPMSVLALGDK